MASKKNQKKEAAKQAAEQRKAKKLELKRQKLMKKGEKKSKTVIRKGVLRIDSDRDRRTDIGKRFGSVGTLYGRILSDYITKGRGKRNEPSGSLRDKEFFYTSNRVMTKKGVRYPLFINSFPAYLERAFVSSYRLSLQQYVDDYNAREGLNLGVELRYIQDSKHYIFDYTKRSIQGKYRFFAKSLQKIEKNRGKQDITEALQDNSYSSEVLRKANSYLYLRDAKDEQHAAFYQNTSVLELIVTGSDMQVADELVVKLMRELEKLLKADGIGYNQVFLQMVEYQKGYSILGARNDDLLIRDMNKGEVVTDDHLTSYSALEHGVVGDKYGICFGADIILRLQAKFDLYGDGSSPTAPMKDNAEVLTVMATTDGGKTVFVRGLLTEFDLDPRYHSVVFDYEGSDYLALSNVLGGVNIDVGGSSGAYVNTIVIPKALGVPEEDSKRKENSMKETMTVFKILLKNEYGEVKSEEEAVISWAIKLVYRRLGVNDNPETWDRSENATLFQVYDALNYMIDGEDKKEVEAELGLGLVKSVKRKLRRFFEKGEVYAHWFTKPLSPEDILNNKFVRFSFEQAGSGDLGDKEDKQFELRQYFAFSLTLKKALYNKINGIKTVVVVEEVQRYLERQHSGEIISTIATGGRKLGIVFIPITNGVTTMLKMSEGKGSGVAKHVSDLLDNTSTFIIGGLPSSTMQRVIDYLGRPNAAGYLMQMAKVIDDKLKNVPLSNAFFISRGGKSTIVRTTIHPDLLDTSIFRSNKSKRNGDGEEVGDMFNLDVDRDGVLRELQNRSSAGLSGATMEGVYGNDYTTKEKDAILHPGKGD